MRLLNRQPCPIRALAYLRLAAEQRLLRWVDRIDALRGRAYFRRPWAVTVTCWIGVEYNGCPQSYQFPEEKNR